MSPEEDQFFDDIFPLNPFVDEKAVFLEAGEMIIYDGALLSLEEQLEHILHRAKIYNEYSLTKLDFCDMIEDLMKRAANIRKTSQGSA